MKIESIVGETILCFEQQSAIIEKYIYIYSSGNGSLQQLNIANVCVFTVGKSFPLVVYTGYKSNET